MTAAGYTAFPVSPQLVVELEETSPPLPAELLPAVEAAWTAAQRRAGGRLFNGSIFSVTELRAERIRGHFTEYRLAVAGYRDAEMADRLRIRQLSVCGVLKLRDGVVFGLRNGRAAYEPGCWQMPPAGAVDPSARRGAFVSFEEQARTELAEEIGLGWDRVTAFRPLTVVVHPHSRVHDLGVLIEADCDFEELQQIYIANGSDEYTSLRLVPPAELPEFLVEQAERVVPAAAFYLAAVGLVVPPWVV
jgi:hypothetical protein